MRQMIPILALLLFAVPGRAAEKGEPVPWSLGKPNPRVVLGEDGAGTVQGEAGATKTMLVELDKPKVPSHQYRLVGQIKYEDVQGVGHLEMWSTFPGGKSFFSKTLGDSGPLSKITGTSDWREVELPFYSKPGLLPEKITVALVLPGGGKVTLRPFRLTEASNASSFASGGWWGAILGGAVGILGALVGTLAAFPRTRRLGFWILVGAIPIGVGLLVAGLVMAAMGQEYGLWYPFVLCGGILAVVAAGLVPTVKRQLGQDELRKMTAHDAGM